MSELERRKLEEPDRGGNPHLYVALGIGFVVAAVLVIGTAGVLAAGLPFVIAAAALLGKGVSELRGQRRSLFRRRSANSASFSRPSGTTAAA